MTDADRSLAGLSALWEYMQTLVARKRQRPGQDVISDLLATAEQDSDLETDGIAMLAAALLFAGHETTVAAIDRGVVLLATHPDQFAELQRDPSRVAPAVEEILRSSLPLPASTVAGDQACGLPRHATEDIEFRGVRIAAGELVLLGLQNANIDARRFTEPDGFDISRAPNPHLSFGHGPRFCIGASLARIELHALVTALGDRLPTLGRPCPWSRCGPVTSCSPAVWSNFPSPGDIIGWALCALMGDPNSCPRTSTPTDCASRGSATPRDTTATSA